MRSRSGFFLALLLLTTVVAADSARAQDSAKPAAAQDSAPSVPQNAAPDAAQSCEVPAYLLTSDSMLPKVAGAVKDAHTLNILVVGSRSSTIPSQEASAYPARLQAYLKEKLPSLAVNVSVELQAKKTAEEN